MKTVTRVAIALSACALMLAVLPTAQARIYRWVDASGTVHFGNTPPSGVRYQAVHPQTTSPSKPAVSGGTPAPAPGKAKQGRRPAAGQARTQQLAASVRRKNCHQARADLKWLQSFQARRALVKGKNGSVHRLTENQRQARIKAARARIAHTCGSN